MRTAVEEEQLAFAAAAGASSSIFFAAACGPAVAQGAKPATQRLIGEENVGFLSKDGGEVGEVALGVGGRGEVENWLIAVVGGLVGGRAWYCRG
jgi:hypothetical protein